MLAERSSSWQPHPTSGVGRVQDRGVHAIVEAQAEERICLIATSDRRMSTISPSLLIDPTGGLPTAIKPSNASLLLAA